MKINIRKAAIIFAALAISFSVAHFIMGANALLSVLFGAFTAIVVYRSESLPRLFVGLWVGVFALVLFMPGFAHAQTIPGISDSTVVVAGTGISGWLAVHFPWWPQVLGVLLLGTEIMSLIPSSIFKPNGWVDLLVKVIQAAGKKPSA